jgi:methionyl-tRNA synthetase
MLDLMEKVKIKDAIRNNMALSSLCNTYMQDTQPWVLAKTNPVRCNQVMNTIV